MPPKKAPRVWAMESAKRILAGMEEVRPRAAMGLAVSPVSRGVRAGRPPPRASARTHASEQAHKSVQERACLRDRAHLRSHGV